MSSYIGKHAQYYNLFYKDKLYKDEAEFVHSCLQEFSKSKPEKLLEMACGTGNHAFELEQKGYVIDAFDYSEDMISQAISNGQKKRSHINFFIKDMRDLSSEIKKYDACICLFDSIGYVLSNDNINKVFAGVRNVLNDDGLFIFEFWHAAAMIKNYSPSRIRRWETDESSILRISETSLNIFKQSATVNYCIYEHDKRNDAISCIRESQENRFFLLQEMIAIIERNKFSPVKFFDGFSNKEIINEDSWHIVAVCKKEK
ncbi:MAG TPA: class I SAM-dependent methyltransferase [Cytophagaceae bacterium]|jgi:SAM-dependent methyltransferase|nr:class I SAM-dependent methyltransferase [Cytophagaceae bacterium]